MNHEQVLATVSAVWVALEIFVAVLTRRTATGHDRGSYMLLWALLGIGCFAAASLHRLPAGRMPRSGAIFWLGIGLIVAGMVIRATAILTLRRFFTVQVTIQESHELIDRGLYRWIRHPAYSGSLVSFAGLGFAFGNWISLAVVLGASLIGLGYRIHVEEAALIAHFGDRYRAYAARTSRLIPGIY